MSVIEVQGLTPLEGEIKIQGSKNAVLPMMAAAILHKGTTVIENVPRIQDVFCMLGILDSIGCKCRLEGNRLKIDASVVTETEIPKEFVKSMRSSIIVSGPLLGRMKRAVTSFPGGCSIGERPIDLHLTALDALGARVEEDGEELLVTANELTGADIYFPFPSVGATENALMAAVLADGVTVIHGAAREPEIEELCLFLIGMGARIHGVGSSKLVIEGVLSLHDSIFTVTGDRIVAGTYLCAVMAAEGCVTLTGIRPSHMEAVLRCAEEMGAAIRRYDDRISVTMTGRPADYSVVTGPYPQFPTDLQSPMMAVMAAAEGTGRMEETVFEGRFGTVKELQKLGADIIIEDNRAEIRGLYPLTGAVVRARDLRGGAALVVAGLDSRGVTQITDCSHIERGYEDICRDLKSLGAVIRGME
ncbi:UDP-N-acetylglucosamine 1-carboxyvinyltransferase [Hungatella effluvii]|uniref:UDP-N-acetylglucosamine 1-carboxyvinyltransferase n=1 Tax=Hungatella effluvii TaxID=1096246 RepID=UPI002A7FF4EE|nr:UDP-N-acetylglucosamine 1-carboxyvinyltransferase [Hungatella effluvii]